MDTPTYATDADLRRRAGISATPTATRDVVDVLEQASRTAEKESGGRTFYPELGTRSFDWPDRAGTNIYTDRLWLDDNELLSVNTLTVNNVSWTEGTDYRLGPPNPDGPYRYVEVMPSSSKSFSTGTDSHQGVVDITATFGYTQDTDNVTTLAAAVSTSTETTITVASSHRVGIGAALKINSEWLIVSDTGWANAADTLAANMDLDTADTTVTVADSTLYSAGETLIVDSERMVVLDIPTATTLSLLRAVDGSIPAAHTSGAQIRALRLLTVTRAALGTAGAAHSSGDTVARLRPPPVLRDYTLALAMVELEQINATYAREIGQGETAREASGRGLRDLRQRFLDELAVKGRFRATGGSGRSRY